MIKQTKKEASNMPLSEENPDTAPPNGLECAIETIIVKGKPVVFQISKVLPSEKRAHPKIF